MKEKFLRLRVYMERNPNCRGMLAKDTIDVPFEMDIKDLLEQIGATALTRAPQGKAEYGWETVRGTGGMNDPYLKLTSGHLEANKEYLLHGPSYEEFEEYKKKFEQFQSKYRIDRQVILGTNFILPEGCTMGDVTSKLVDILHKD